MQQDLRSYVRRAGTYVFGDIVTRGAALLLLPVYTSKLAPADYGILAVATMVGGLLSMLFSLGMSGSVLRFAPRMEPAERHDFLGTVWTTLLLGGGVMAALLLLLGPALTNLVLQQTPFHPYLSLTILAVYVQASSTTMLLALLRVEEQAGTYVRVNLANFGLLATLTVLLVVGLELGAYGAVLAQVIAASAIAGYAALRLSRVVKLRLNRQHLSAALAYGLPLVPALLAQWALSASDRAILERYVDLADLGVYALANQFGSALALLAISLSNALTPAFSRAADDPVERQTLRRASGYYLLALTSLALGLALILPPLIRLILRPAYHPAAVLTPWLILAHLLLGIYYLFASALAFTGGRSGALSLISGSGAALNLGLNLLLIPRYGVFAAVVTTVGGYGALVLLALRTVQQRGLLLIDGGRAVRLFAAAAAAYLISWSLMGFGPWRDLFVALAGCLLLPLFLVIIGYLDPQERRIIGSLWRKYILSGGTRGQ